MATYYCSAVSSTGVPPHNIYQDGFAHARIRKTYSTYTNSSPYVAITNDVLVIGLFRSSDRLFDIKFYTDGAGTNGAFNIGLHKVTRANGSLSFTAVDAVLFATAKATGTALW